MSLIDTLRLLQESKLNYFAFPILSEQNSNLDTLWSTVEPVDLVEKAYPDLVKTYLDTISAKTKKSTKVTKASTKNGRKAATKATQKKLNKLQDVIVDDDNAENVDPEKLKRSKKTSQKKVDGKTERIDKYFKKVKKISSVRTPTMQQKKQPLTNKPLIESPKIETSSIPLRLTELSFDFDDATDDIHDLSNIIQGIVSNSPTIRDICGKKLHYECANKQLELRKTIDRDEKNETIDEFDIIVAGMKSFPTESHTPTTSRKKTKKRSVDSRLAAENIDDHSPSTTPIIIKKFFKRNYIDHKPTVTSSTPTNSPQNESFKSISSPKLTEANISYFFGNITDENDAFEKLIDFRNMEDEDEICANKVDDVDCIGDELQEINGSPPIELSETFDLDDYVPVGANLRKRLAS